MKKILFIIILIVLVIISFLFVLFPVIKNSNYIKNMENDIYNNTEIKEINYLNKDNNYYIVKTLDKIIVFDLNYDEVYSIATSKVYDSDLDLTYRRNNLYFVEKKRKNNKLIYKFYDIITNEFVYEVSVGG